MKWFRRGRVASVLLSLIVTSACSDAVPPPPPKPDPSAASELPVVGKEVRILALGDSLFTGYGLDNGLSYPAQLEAALRARGINARIANAGVSGDTTQGGAARVKFALDGQPQPPAMVLISLGGNDMLRGLPPEQTRANLDAILTELNKRKIKAVLLGMLAAPNLGADYAGAFNPIYPALAKKHGAALVPFFLQPLVDNPGLVQGDRIHPTMAGIEAMVAATVEQVAGAVK
jgi:acyl-CoA thioesterase-1